MFVRIGAAATRATVTVNGREVGRHLGAWTPFEFEITRYLRDQNELTVHCTDCHHTTNGFLPHIGVRWTGARDIELRDGPAPLRRAAVQRSAARGRELLVDGRATRIRGILHWGWYPELDQPWPDEERMRWEIEHVKSLGFNLIKFCLWIPPPRYYELCDEYDMLAWQEYPVWNTPLESASILQEYEEFFRLDGPHPCVILRSLTCENDHVDPGLARDLVDLARRLIPKCLIIDNSSWLCLQRLGDFQDEHPYLNNMQWRYYAARVRDRLTKPFILGESMAVNTPRDGPFDTALAIRRHQVETLARELPSAGYVMTGLRDIDQMTLGILTRDGKAKYRPDQWDWHRDDLSDPRDIPELQGAVIGPRKGEWKCPESPWRSASVRVLDASLPEDLIREHIAFDLLSGRVLENVAGTRVLVELEDMRHGAATRHPLVIEFQSQGVRRIVSAFRHDTPVGRELWDVLKARRADAPEIGPLIGTAIVLENWEMSRDGQMWLPVRCDTPLVNAGRNVFEGWAIFRTKFDYPGGTRTLRCEAVGDYYLIQLDGAPLAEVGPREGTWGSARESRRDFAVALQPGIHTMEIRVRDWRGAGAMVGPVYLADDLTQRVF